MQAFSLILPLRDAAALGQPAGAVFRVAGVREGALDRGALQSGLQISGNLNLLAPPTATPPAPSCFPNAILAPPRHVLGSRMACQPHRPSFPSLTLHSRSQGTVWHPQELTGSFQSIVPSSARLICSACKTPRRVTSSTNACLLSLTLFFPTASCSTQWIWKWLICHHLGWPRALGALVLPTLVFPANNPGWGTG